ncbi:MAG: 3-methyl-2-oxobutanoate hydroxymethyltransferase [Pseudomonadota bacterium]|jgi:3-methyl-2-oxobutanoate hydroxymethyltransferase
MSSQPGAKDGAARKKVTIATLAQMRAASDKITMLTAYDASFAALMDQAGVDTLLVGDSLGMVVQGHGTTLPVTLADVAYHTACVARGVKSALVIGDMPFGTYATPQQAHDHAAVLMRAGAEMVKVEGGSWLTPTVQLLVERGIPVCGHLGLTPQSVHQLGGFKVQGKTATAADQLKADALALQAAGAAMIVLEAIPAALAAEVTQMLSIPTIGIGGGVDCSGQVLVMHDMLGAYPGHRPKFVKNFMDGQGSIAGAIAAYVREVKAATFPGPEHSF